MVLTWAAKSLLMAEICNENEGVIATLESTLDSVRQGYNPDPDEDYDMQKVEDQLVILIKEFGPNYEANDFIHKADWDRRFEIAYRKKKLSCNEN